VAVKGLFLRRISYYSYHCFRFLAFQMKFCQPVPVGAIFEGLMYEVVGSYFFTLMGMASSATGNAAFGNGMALTASLYMLLNDEGHGKLNPAISFIIFLWQELLGGIPLGIDCTNSCCDCGWCDSFCPRRQSSGDMLPVTVPNVTVLAWETLGTFPL